MKIFLAILVIVTFGFWGYHKYQNNRPEFEEFFHYNTPAKAQTGSASSNAKLDVAILDSFNKRLIATCGDNKFGLTEETCVLTINERKGFCQQQTVDAFPQQPATQERMQAVLNSHINCLFHLVSSKTN